MPESRHLEAFAKNQQWVAQGDHVYNTPLGEDEPKFQQWVHQNKVPFDVNAPVSDYDMRGFWKALKDGDPKAQSAVNQNDKKIHYPDYWKTPYHQSFSAESKFADPSKAPKWNEKDQLVAPNGSVVYDERRAGVKAMYDKSQQNAVTSGQLASKASAPPPMNISPSLAAQTKVGATMGAIDKTKDAIDLKSLKPTTGLY